ncbi:phage minor capsid protein [Clostridium beijerinckii]|uniref:phage minor capsid protein n=1 Tax=Clostridium beijerinckii TaxID=1520 RepID=UPI0030D84314
MLTPNYLENFPQTLAELYQELENFIIIDVARRLKTAGQSTSTAEWQKQQAQLYNINNINQKVSEILKKSNSEIEKMFAEAALTTIASENKTFKKAGYKGIELEDSKALQNYLKTAIKQTKGDVENITQSMGFAEKQGNKIVYNNIAKFYQKELNLAHIKVSTGVLDYNTAIKQAINKIADSGVRQIVKKKGVPQVEYESGYSINIDSAARRAVLTSVHQFNQETINHMSSEIIKDEENRYYEVTAHPGARTGIGINNHAGWQGKVYKWLGSTADYPNLKETTGLGDLLGLEGINCKHSYFIFIPNISVRTYTDEQLKNIDPPPFTYKDKEYTYYETTQYQRELENKIRKLKREALMYKETGLDTEFKNTNKQIKDIRNEYKAFSDAADIRPKLERTQI